VAKQRSIITPEHFTVAPQILGLPLASPSRRAVAMAIDLFLIMLLVKTGGVILGIVAGALLFRASTSEPGSGFIRRSVRNGLRLTGAVLLSVVIYKAWGALQNRNENDGDESESPSAQRVENELDLKLAPGDLPALAGSFFTLRRAEDSAAVARAAETVLKKAKASGATRADLYGARSELVELMGDNGDDSEVAAIDDAIRAVAGEKPAVPARDSLVQAYLAATKRNDSSAIAAYADSVKTAFAGEEISELTADKRRLDNETDSLARELVSARKAHGVRAFIAGAADDLGVGFGWSAVYFTAFLALWRGQTPGKRAARVRVLRLDGKPLGWWISFERFGGYAASFSVGLIGFVQILWDRNRQGLHDKACETVVVRDLTPTR
jgi:uncharacterized RDD family membrane protein YckC